MRRERPICTAERAAIRSLERARRVLRTITATGAVLVHATEEVALLQDTCEVIVSAGAYALAWIAIPDPDHPRLVRPAAISGGRSTYHEEILAASGDRPVECGPATQAIASRATQWIDDFRDLPAGTPIREVSLAYGYRSQISIPLIVEGELIGALSILGDSPGAFAPDEVPVFEQLAEDLAYGLTSLRVRMAKQRYFDMVGRNMAAMVETVAATAEARDPYTAGHQRNVARLAGAIARHLGLDADVVTGIETAAGIHDVGKIAVPAEILSKPGALSRPEFEIIREHPRTGHDILASIEFPWPVAEMILQHHERLDGSGYPAGLRGDEILLGAQVIAVADVVEAMASHRPYRAAKGIEVALQQIATDRGRLLRTEVVDACLEVFRSELYSVA